MSAGAVRAKLSPNVCFSGSWNGNRTGRSRPKSRRKLPSPRGRALIHANRSGRLRYRETLPTPFAPQLLSERLGLWPRLIARKRGDGRILAHPRLLQTLLPVDYAVLVNGHFSRHVDQPQARLDTPALELCSEWVAFGRGNLSLCTACPRPNTWQQEGNAATPVHFERSRVTLAAGGGGEIPSIQHRRHLPHHGAGGVIFRILRLFLIVTGMLEVFPAPFRGKPCPNSGVFPLLSHNRETCPKLLIENA
jgi:hypothetical protein